ncbi:MAG: NADH:flavin oxidoreductase/NADH oxidase [Actinomycetaceae bacterium]|nr:NADH:flavin oxidoreductase/NADH oxidase [Actinomycetaceae bacterium]
MTPALFHPITLRSVEFRNRLWVPPMCQYSAENRDGMVGDWHLVHYGAIARGGVGSIIVEATAVSPEGRITPHDLGLWNSEQETSFAPLVQIVHSHGAKVGVQIAHAGRKSGVYRAWGESDSGPIPSEHGGWQPVAPSAAAYPGYAEPRELSVDDIQRLTQAFIDAAVRAERVGFDFIEIHAAHGYLLHEFLSPLSNSREDTYGGSIENRARFLLQVVEGIRARISTEMPLLVRVSATDWTDGGLTVEETIEIVRWLKDLGVDLIDVSAGGNVSKVSVSAGPGYLVPIATAIREVTGVPTATVGLITQPQQAEQIVLTGLADVVLVGREILRDPHFGLRAARDLRATINYVPPQYARAFR